MSNTVYQSPRIKVRVSDAGALQPTTPITLKNTVGTGRTLNELLDVTVINPANSDIIVYNANSGNWENIAPIPTTIVSGNTSQILVTNSTPYAYTLSLPNTVIIANSIVVGSGFAANSTISTFAAANVTGNLTVGGITSLSGIAAGNTTITGYANISGTANIGGNTTIGGYVSVGSYANIAGNTTIGGFANVAGSLNVAGNTTLANVTITGDVTFNDNIIVLNNEFTGAPTEDAGFIVNRGALANASLLWVEATDNWSTNGASIVVGNSTINSTSLSANNIGTSNLVVGTINRDPTITVTLTGDVTGTASGTLSNLANGTISVATEVSNNSVTLGQHTQGSYVANVQPGTGVYITNAGGEGSDPTIAIGQDVNTNSVVTFGNTTIVGLANVSSLRVTTSSQLDGQLTVNGAVGIVNTLNAGNTVITGLINVSSTSQLTGNVVVKSELVVNGAVTIANTLATGTTSVTGFINVSTTANVGGIATFRNNVIANGTLTVANTANVGNTTVTGFINVSSTANVGGQITARANVTVNGALTVANVMSAGNTTITGFANIIGNVAVSDTITGKDMSLTGNLSVNGTLTYINTTTLNVGDNIITLNADLGAVAPTEDSGFEVNRGTSANVSFLWNETTDKWTTGNVAVGTVTSSNTDITGYINVSTTANVGGNASIIGTLTVTNTAALGNTTVTGFINVSSTADIGGNLYVSTITTSGTNANLVLDPNGTGVVVIANASGGAVGIELGTPTLGVLVSNAVSMTTNTSVTDGVAQLNKILGKLVPPSPPAFPNGAITLLGTTSYRMANFTQTDNTPSTRNVAGGVTVSSIRTTTFTTSNVVNSGPGDSGTVTAYFNNVATGSITLASSLTANATNGMLRFYNNLDYNTVNTSIAAGFWSVFSANGSGTGVTAGWNEFKIGHSAAGNTSTVAWYCDTSAPGTPIFSGATFTPTAISLTYSSTVPHYNNSTTFGLTFYVNRLSGDLYPASDTFATGTAGGAFSAPVSVTYTTAGVTTPLARNLFVASGNTGAVTSTANVISGFGSSAANCSVTVNNSYNSGVQQFNPGAIVLYKTALTNNISTVEEANVYFGSAVGVGTGAASRIINSGSTDNPTYAASALIFNSQTSTLQVYDPTVVGGVLKHDQTNYSTGYLPAGPNLSAGRSGSQYFTFKFIRTSLQKFDIRYTGTIAGMWVAMPGSTVDTTSTLNGWLDCSVAYNNIGTPGANTAAGGNGTNGCGLSNLAVLNSAQTNKNVTATFGPVSTSSTATNEIYVRIKLTSGQSVTALSLQTNSA